VGQGREVFAVPGSPLDPRAEGTNDLLRQGATLCTCAQDVIDVLTPILREGIPLPGNLFESESMLPNAEPLWDELDLLEEPAPLTLAGHELDEEAGPPYMPRLDRTPKPGNVAARLTALLGPSPVNVDDLSRLASAPMADVRMVLLELELSGNLERHGGNLVSLIGSVRPQADEES
jgi:DNA processing protein